MKTKCPYTFLRIEDFKHAEQYQNALASAKDLADSFNMETLEKMLKESPKNDIYKHALGIIKKNTPLMNYDGATGEYLLNLDRREGIPDDGKKVWLPKLSVETIDSLKKSDNPFVVANDWFSQGCYEMGAWVFTGDGYAELQEEVGTLLNEGFAFEYDNQGHKGLVALEITKKTEFFVMNNMFPFGEDRGDIALFFDTSFVSEAYIEKVTNYFTDKYPDSKITVKRQWLVLYADDYTNMVEQLPTLLI